MGGDKTSMLLTMARVLVVEDEEDIAFPLVRTLEREGYAVTWVEDGQTALDRLKSEQADVVILDLGLPDMDGLEVCRKAREAGYEGAIMIVTARAGELDRVVGLDYGADDYLAKPFGLAELQARVRALLRRTSGSQGSTDDPDGRGRRERAPDRRGRPAGLRRPRRGLAHRQGVRGPQHPRGQPRQGGLPGPVDGRRVGRELVRLHQDPRRHHRAAPSEARERRASPSA